MRFTTKAGVSLFFAIFTKLSDNLRYVSLIKCLEVFKISSALYRAFARERVKRVFFKNSFRMSPKSNETPCRGQNVARVLRAEWGCRSPQMSNPRPHL